MCEVPSKVSVPVGGTIGQVGAKFTKHVVAYMPTQVHTLIIMLIIRYLHLNVGNVGKTYQLSTFFGAKKEGKKHPPSPRPLPIWRGCN